MAVTRGIPSASQARANMRKSRENLHSMKESDSHSNVTQSASTVSKTSVQKSASKSAAKQATKSILRKK